MIPKGLSTDYVISYQKFAMSIESYLCEALSQITYKLYKIRNNVDVEYPKEIDLLIKAFNTQYDKRIIDRIMIVNEIDRKFNFDDGYFSYSTSPMLPIKQK